MLGNESRAGARKRRGLRRLLQTGLLGRGRLCLPRGEVAAGHADGFIRDNLAVATNLVLFNNITNGNGISLDDAAFPKILEGIRTGLAKAYVNYLDGQAATESDPFVPSRKDIGSFHIDIFR
jgi:hypothetical protein